MDVNTFLAGVGTGSASIVMGNYVKNYLAVGWSRIIRKWEEMVPGKAMQRRCKLLEEKILGRSLRDFSIDVGDKHPLLKGRLHPDNLKLATSFAQLLMSKNQLIPVGNEKQLKVDFEKSVWAIGGAMSTWTSYLAENYQGTEYNLKWTGKSKLPWRIVYDEEELKQLDVLSYSNSNLETEGRLVPWSVPNWVAIENETGEFLSTPTTGEIIQQPLLISKLPNTIGKTPESKHEIVFITEAPHGDGTRGFKLLLNDIEKLEEWRKEISNYDYFQSRFKVTLSRKNGIPDPYIIEHIETRELTKKDIK
jgi:hypothetical protein